MLDRKNTRAFTIIEVMAVFAIAGLIFLVVFAAIPRMQSARRDSERKTHAQEMLEAVSRYRQNTESGYPTGLIFGGALYNNTNGAPLSEYFRDEAGDLKWSDPSTKSEYTYSGVFDGNSMSVGQVTGARGHLCSASGTSIYSTGAGSPDFALMIRLEKGVYCIDDDVS